METMTTWRRLEDNEWYGRSESRPCLGAEYLHECRQNTAEPCFRGRRSRMQARLVRGEAVSSFIVEMHCSIVLEHMCESYMSLLTKTDLAVAGGTQQSGYTHLSTVPAPHHRMCHNATQEFVESSVRAATVKSVTREMYLGLQRRARACVGQREVTIDCVMNKACLQALKSLLILQCCNIIILHRGCVRSKRR